jgi:hypothetical protein
MERLGSGAYANVFGHKTTAYKIPQKWSTSEIHTVLREGLLLRLGFGPGLEGLCFEKSLGTAKRFYGFAMPRALCTLDRWNPTNDFGSLQSIMLQVAAQLRKLHISGLVHADIKPKNILIYENGIAKLCDFGLVTHAGTTGNECYTVNYRPPEHLESSRAIEFSSDMWALGITFYDVLFGLSSMGLSSPKDVLAKTKLDIPEEGLDKAIKQKFLTCYARSSEFFETILAKCLCYDPCARPSIQYIEWTSVGPLLGPLAEVQLVLKPSSGRTVPMDFEVTTLLHDAEPLARPLQARNMDTFYSVCKSLCTVVQVEQTLIEPHALQLVKILKNNLDMRLTLACAVSVSFCIYLNSII